MQFAGAIVSWRTVVVCSRCKLDTKMGYMVIRGEEVRRIFLDEIAVVMNGRITERGTHEELMAAGGKYRDLYALQFRDNDLFE